MATTSRRAAIIGAFSALAAQFVPRRIAFAISAADYCPSAEEREVFQRLNALRTSQRLSPLKMDRSLGAAARHHANDMSARSYFSHTTPEGEGSSSRARNHGYGGRMIGENIARGQQGPAQVMQSWESSSGHRANMLNAQYGAVGVGYDPNGRYWVQVFGDAFTAGPTCGSPGPRPKPRPKKPSQRRQPCRNKRGKARKVCLRRRRQRRR
jgi:uncharacterized protein YkwD